MVCSDTLTPTRSRLGESGRRGPLLDVAANIGLARKPGGGHRTYLAEYGSLWPRPIMQPEYPSDIGVRIGVAPVEEEGVI